MANRVAIKAANDPRSYSEDDMFHWCGCGKGNWMRQDPETGWWHVICTKCEADHTMRIVGQ